MIKNRIIVAISAVLVFILGIQFYMLFHLNDRLNQLSAQDKLTGSPQIKIPKQPTPTIPKPGMGDEFSKDQLWNHVL